MPSSSRIFRLSLCPNSPLPRSKLPVLLLASDRCRSSAARRDGLNGRGRLLWGRSGRSLSQSNSRHRRQHSPAKASLSVWVGMRRRANSWRVPGYLSTSWACRSMPPKRPAAFLREHGIETTHALQNTRAESRPTC